MLVVDAIFSFSNQRCRTYRSKELIESSTVMNELNGISNERYSRAHAQIATLND